MNTKPLYYFPFSYANGEFGVHFTFDPIWIKEMSEVLGKDVACEHYLYECYCPSGEFKPETLNVPEHCTLESLGVDEYPAKVDDLKQLLAFTYGEA